MPSYLATITLALGVVSGLAGLTILLWLIHRTRLRLIVALVASVMMGVLAWSAVLAFTRYCTQSARHIDCIPDRFEYMFPAMKRFLVWDGWLDWPVLLAPMVLLFLMALTRRIK